MITISPFRYFSCLFSKSQKGMLTVSISGFSFLSLSTVSSAEVAKGIIDRERRRLRARKDAGLLPVGLQRQYEILIESYERCDGGECEIICFPGWFGKGGECSFRLYVARY